MNEQYEKLRQVIIAANPEIMELDTGCVVQSDNRAYLVGSSDVHMLSQFKIIGRPIRLADVLLAIEKHGLNDQIEYHNILFDLLVKNESLWNLRNDNLDHQSDETKQFLINLLVK